MTTKAKRCYRRRFLSRRGHSWIALALSLGCLAVLLAAGSALARSPKGAVQLDRTFGDSGRVFFPDSEDLEDRYLSPTAVISQPSGRIVVAWADYAWALTGFTANGAVDPTYGQDGTAYGSTAPIRGAINQPDGKIVVVLSGSCGTCAVRYDENGVRDQSFGNGGVVVLQIAGLRLRAPVVAAAQAGKIVVAGWVAARRKRQGAVMRLNPDGSADASFGQGGQTRFRLARSDRRFFGVGAVDVQKDGGILVGSDDPGIYRVKSNGVLDNSFGKRGRVATKVVPTAIETQPDRKIVVAGWARDYECDPRSEEGDLTREGSVSGVVRHFPEGRLDRRFGDRGFAPIWHDRRFCRLQKVYDLIVRRSGEIIVGGNQFSDSFDTLNGVNKRQQPMVAGFKRSGRRDKRFRDNTFGADGITSFGFGKRWPLDPCPSMTAQADGKILLLCGRVEREDSFGVGLVLLRFSGA